MEATELRLGNIINYALFPNFPDSHGEVIVTSIDETHISYRIKDEEFTYWHEDFQPIPLTEEWLLKFGFEKQHNEDDFDYWFKKDFCDDILWQHLEGFCHNLNYGGDIKYVHQLQNLFFTLTGEELTM